MNQALAQNALKDAVAAHRAHVRWLTWCEGLIAAMKTAGVYEPTVYPRELAISVERTYMTANKRPSMPSKNRKYRMYDDIYRAASLAGLDIVPGSIRDMNGVARVIAEVTAALAVAV